jgi:hypothetical protein
MAKRCYCTAVLRDDGNCPYRCPATLQAPARRERSIPTTVRRRAIEDGKFPTHAEVRTAFTKAVPEARPADVKLKIKRELYKQVKRAAETEAMTVNAWVRRQIRIGVRR